MISEKELEPVSISNAHLSTDESHESHPVEEELKIRDYSSDSSSEESKVYN